MEEKWAPISVSPGNEVSTLGRIKGVGGKILELAPDITTGYVRATLGQVGQRKKYRVHRLVAEAFLANPDNKPVVNHINGNPSDNCVENLEWATAQENNERKVNPSKQGRPRPVAHVSAEGKILQTWDSADKASEYLGVSPSAVSMCCRGENSTCANKVLVYLDQIDLPKEEWRETEYMGMTLEASSLGRVKTKSGIKTFGNEVNGYMMIKPEKKTVFVHRLVATAFCEKPDGSDVVNHKDGVSKNNCAENLEWCTATENACHAVRTGLTKAGIASSARAVRQYLPGEKFKDYISISEAAKQTGVYRRTIGKACAGEVMKAGGFRWAFVPITTSVASITGAPAIQYIIPDDDLLWAELGL